MASYKELQEQIAELQREAQAARAHEVQAAIKEIRSIMDEFGIAAEDLEGGRAEKGRKPQSKAGIRFRGGDNTWSGRGRTPLWLKNKDKEKQRVR